MSVYSVFYYFDCRDRSDSQGSPPPLSPVSYFYKFNMKYFFSSCWPVRGGVRLAQRWFSPTTMTPLGLGKVKNYLLKSAITALIASLGPAAELEFSCQKYLDSMFRRKKCKLSNTSVLGFEWLMWGRGRVIGVEHCYYRNCLVIKEGVVGGGGGCWKWRWWGCN